MEQIEDPRVKRIAECSPMGSLDLLSENTDLVSNHVGVGLYVISMSRLYNSLYPMKRKLVIERLFQVSQRLQNQEIPHATRLHL